MASTVQVERVVTGSLAANCYVLACAGDAVVIDAGDDCGRISSAVDAAAGDLRAVLATHGHSDHVGAVAALAERYDAPFHLHPLDGGLLRRANFYRAVLSGDRPIDVPSVAVDLADGMTLRFGELEIDVLHTPGHSPGSVCFVVEGELFTGDTLTADGPGRSDLPGSDPAALESSIARLSALLSADTAIRPGHGGPTSLGGAVAEAGALERVAP